MGVKNGKQKLSFPSFGALTLHYREAAGSRRQRGQVVRALNLQFGGPKFKSRSDHELDLFTVVLSFMLVNSQLVCLWPVGILNPVKFNLNYLSIWLLGDKSGRNAG